MSQLPIWATVLTFGAAAAVVIVLASRFVAGPRLHLRFAPSTALVEDSERITRRNEGEFTSIDILPVGLVRLANHGDGIAHDVRLTGEVGRPRGWIGDTSVKPYAEQPIDAEYPLGSNTVAAIGLGMPTNVSADARHGFLEVKPTITTTWPGLPSRRWAGSRTVTLGFAIPRQDVYGRSGQTALGEA